MSRSLTTNEILHHLFKAGFVDELMRYEIRDTQPSEGVGQKTELKCPSCGSNLKEIKGDHIYRESGLYNVELMGIQVLRCTKKGCGEVMPVLKAIDKLHDAIADALIKKSSSLTGSEFRFLRKEMEISIKRLAELLGVAPGTVSRWENSNIKIRVSYDVSIKELFNKRRVSKTYKHYTYRVTWSEEDNEYAGLCAEFPGVSWRSKTPYSTMKGIRKVVANVIEDMKKTGDLMKYKGYTAVVNYNDDDKVFHSKVEGIRDLLCFEGNSVEELEKAFHEFIDEYLADCKRTGGKSQITSRHRAEKEK